MNIMKLVPVFLIAAVLGWGQTAVPVQSLKAGASLPASATPTGVIVFTPSGFYTGTLQQLASLLAPLMGAPKINKKTVVLTSWDGSTATAAIAGCMAGTVEVHRNGLEMSETADYSLSADGTVTFVAAQTPQPGDIVKLSCFQ